MWKWLIDFYHEENVAKVCKGYADSIFKYGIIFIIIALIKKCAMKDSFEYLKVIAAMSATVAVTGNKGWGIQTYGGNTTAEKLNIAIITILVTVAGGISLFL